MTTRLSPLRKKIRIYSKIQKHSCKKTCTMCNVVTAHYLLFSLQILWFIFSLNSTDCLSSVNQPPFFSLPAGCVGRRADHCLPHCPHLPGLDPHRLPGLGQPPLPCVCHSRTVLLVLQLPGVRLLQPNQGGHDHHRGCRGWSHPGVLDQPLLPAGVPAQPVPSCDPEHPAPDHWHAGFRADEIYGGNCVDRLGSSAGTEPLAASVVLVVQGGDEEQGGQAKTGDWGPLQVCHLHVGWHLCHDFCAHVA